MKSIPKKNNSFNFYHLSTSAGLDRKAKVTGICTNICSICEYVHHRCLKLGSKLKYLNYINTKSTYPICDMVKQELRVTSYKLRVTNYELKP